jgi:hypothetical protein
MKNENNRGFNFKAKQWIPVSGLILLTIALIIFFKHKSLNVIVDEQKHNIVEFYTQNLKPLLIKSAITNEDVYNFAINNELPLDKTNKQYLKLNDGSSENKYFEFIKSTKSEAENNLNDFKKSIRLNEVEKQKVDSILESYQDELRKQILINDNNTIAINPNLWNLNKAIKTDLLMYASKTNNEKFKKYFPDYYAFYKDPSLYKFVKKAKETKDSNYIFVTPDSIFSSFYKLDQKKLDKEIAELNKKAHEWEKNYKVRIAFQNEMFKQQIDKSKRQYAVHIDSNFCRIQIPDVVIPPINIPELSNVNIDLNKVLKIANDFKLKILTKKGKKINSNDEDEYELPDSPETPNEYELNVAIPELNGIIKSTVAASLGIVKSLKIPNVNLDSIMETVNIELSDSLGKFDEKALRKQMEELKEKLEKEKHRSY